MALDESARAEILNLIRSELGKLGRESGLDIRQVGIPIAASLIAPGGKVPRASYDKCCNGCD
jgi:hypothetical protein